MTPRDTGGLGARVQGAALPRTSCETLDSAFSSENGKNAEVVGAPNTVTCVADAQLVWGLRADSTVTLPPIPTCIPKPDSAPRAHAHSLQRVGVSLGTDLLVIRACN